MPRAVWIAVATYFLVLTALGIDRYVTYRSGVDLGLFAQSIADAAHGMRNQLEGGSHYVYHFSPLLYIAWPLLLAVHSPIVLIALQALAGALTAPAIYLLARRRMPERLAIMAATISLLYPPLVGVSFTDFHEAGFAPAVSAWLVWAVDGRRFGLAALFAAAALSIKEDQAYALLVLGAGYGVFCVYRRDRVGAAFGAALSLASAAVLAAFFVVVRPLAGANLSWVPLGYYLANKPGESQGFAALFFRVTFLIEALGPLLFLPLRSPWFLLAVPGLVEVLASRWSITYTMGQHYAGVWIGYVLCAFVLALANIARKNVARAETLAKACMVVCVLILLVASPTHWGHFLSLRTEHHRALDRALALIPRNASVGAVDEVYVHLALDPNARPGYKGNPEYLVVDEQYDSSAWRQLYSHQLDECLRSGAYELISRNDAVALYRLRKRG